MLVSFLFPPPEVVFILFFFPFSPVEDLYALAKVFQMLLSEVSSSPFWTLQSNSAQAYAKTGAYSSHRKCLQELVLSVLDKSCPF